MLYRVLKKLIENGSTEGLAAKIDIFYAAGKLTDNEYTELAGLLAAYTVTYDGNGAESGTVPTDSNTYSSGASVTVLDNTGSLAKDGYTFAGWNTAADGTGTAYAAGDTMTISADITLYAQWTAAE